MDDLWTGLTRALDGPWIVALGASFLWGILSLLLSPCHLSSIPLVVGYLGGGTPAGPWRAFRISLAFAGGILVTLLIIGTLTAILGRVLGDVGPWGDLLVAVLFVWVGLSLMGILPFPSFPNRSTPRAPRGAVGAWMLGLLFGTGVGACTFAYLAPVLGVVFQSGRMDLIRGSSFLLAFALGHVGIIVVAGTFFESLRRYLHWNEHSAVMTWVRRVAGALVLLAGLYLAWVAIRRWI